MSVIRPRLPGLALGFGFGLLAKELGLPALVSYWGPFAPWMVLFGIVGMALWTPRFRIAIVAPVVATTLVWLLVAFSPLCRILARPLVRTDRVSSADAIYVLSANVHEDDEASTASMSRALRGLELLGQHLAPRLLVSELAPPAGSYLVYLRHTAAELGGFEARSIENVGTVHDTHDEAIRVAAVFREHGWQRLLLVTSPTHTRRAAAAFERAGVPIVISVPASETQVDLRHLRFPDERIVAFGFVAHEWVGLLVYHLRGWI